MHDETAYKDPMAFNPERFLGDSKELDPRNMVFGFGRRYDAHFDRRTNR